jgi:hypothetical protein
MRGSDQRSGSLFSYVDLESRVGGDHPLRPIREVVNGALSDLSVEFEATYAAGVVARRRPASTLMRTSTRGSRASLDGPVLEGIVMAGRDGGRRCDAFHL